MSSTTPCLLFQDLRDAAAPPPVGGPPLKGADRSGSRTVGDVTGTAVGDFGAARVFSGFLGTGGGGDKEEDEYTGSLADDALLAVLDQVEKAEQSRSVNTPTHSAPTYTSSAFSVTEGPNLGTDWSVTGSLLPGGDDIGMAMPNAGATALKGKVSFVVVDRFERSEEFMLSEEDKQEQATSAGFQAEHEPNEPNPWDHPGKAGNLVKPSPRTNSTWENIGTMGQNATARSCPT
ncbi:hypothetical protein ACA910_001635 [Epithemia clementina (nom. ined.)]